MGRKEDCQAAQKEKIAATKFCKVQNKYVPGLFELFEATADPRNPYYITYSNRIMLGQMYFKGVAGITSMQGMTQAFNNKAVSKNLSILMGCPKRKHLPHHVTENEYLERLSPEELEKVIGVFTARAGMGKTYALRCLMNGLNPNQYQTAYISLSTISVTEFYREFCTLLGLEASDNKTGMFRAIQERVYYLYREKKQPLVLAIDEAQYLNYNILRVT